jgi:hypothetical protein
MGDVSGLDGLLRSAGVSSLADAAVVRSGLHPEDTRAGLDRAAGARPAVIVLEGEQARAEAGRWASTRDDWLVLVDPPAGTAVLVPVRTVLEHPNLEGVWRGGSAPVAGDHPPRDGASVAHGTTQAPRTARERTLSAQVSRLQLAQRAQRNETDRLREAWLQDRAWVADQAERVRASTSWRLGHRVMRILRTITFRRHRGSDALSGIIERMQDQIGP